MQISSEVTNFLTFGVHGEKIEVDILSQRQKSVHDTFVHFSERPRKFEVDSLDTFPNNRELPLITNIQMAAFGHQIVPLSEQLLNFAGVDSANVSEQANSLSVHRRVTVFGDAGPARVPTVAQEEHQIREDLEQVLREVARLEHAFEELFADGFCFTSLHVESDFGEDELAQLLPKHFMVDLASTNFVDDFLERVFELEMTEMEQVKKEVKVHVLEDAFAQNAQHVLAESSQEDFNENFEAILVVFFLALVFVETDPNARVLGAAFDGFDQRLLVKVVFGENDVCHDLSFVAGQFFDVFVENAFVGEQFNQK